MTNVEIPMKKTKIICTMGPQEEDPVLMRKLFEAGMDVARFNFSHGTHEEQLGRIRTLKKVREETKKPVAMLLDTKGPEIRTGILVNHEKVTLEAGNTVTLTAGDFPGTAEHLSITYDKLCEDVKEGSTVLIDDGLIELKVEKVDGKDILCRIINGGVVSERKGINVPGVRTQLPAITEKDVDDILWGISQGFDIIAASFIRDAEGVRQIRKLLRDNGSYMPIYSKIECSEALENIDEIIDESDGIMVARGDLGVEIPNYEVPYWQKLIIEKCNLAYKPVITATQMLESMIHNPRPTRAEVTDVANAIYDGTDAIMLSGETAVGKYPVEAVRLMSQVAENTETHFDAERFILHRTMEESDNISSAVCIASVRTARNVHAKAIIIPTQFGQTARLMSNFRPQMPMIAVTPNSTVQRRMMAYWGITPVLGEQQFASADIVQHAITRAKDMNLIKVGDLVVITAGDPVTNNVVGVGHTTNMMYVVEVK